jgi:hypothetical protein
LFVDPGVHKSAFALFREGVLERLYYTGGRPLLYEPLDAVLVEVPQVYSGSKSKGDPNDLIDLALAAGKLLGHLGMGTTVKPRDWKGTIEKSKMTEIIKTKLSGPERTVVREFQAVLKIPGSKMHNIYDAIGIGLWYHGRLDEKVIHR